MLTALPEPPRTPPVVRAHHRSEASHWAWRAPLPTTLPALSPHGEEADLRGCALCSRLKQDPSLPASYQKPFIPKPTGIFTRLQVPTLVSAYPIQLPFKPNTNTVLQQTNASIDQASIWRKDYSSAFTSLNKPINFIPVKPSFQSNHGHV